MIGTYRTAFQPKFNKTPLDMNVDQIIQVSQIKLRELITEKEKIEARTSLLIGKNELIIKEIDHIHNQIQSRKSLLNSLEAQFQAKQSELSSVDENLKKVIEECKLNEGAYKTQLNQVNCQLDSIKDGTTAESSSHKFETKRKCQELIEIQNENSLLKEKMYRLNLELYSYEMAQRNSNVNENTNAIKAQNGIEIMSQLFK